MNLNEKNMTLLTQGEIDTLVGFLEQKKGTISDEVMSQDSIDKLIYLVSSQSSEGIKFDRLFNPSIQSKCLEKAGLKEEGQTCELLFETEETFVVLKIRNQETGKEKVLTPEGFTKEDMDNQEGEWGVSIMPALFDEIAIVLGVKYTQETYQKVCEKFAQTMFGDRDYKIPSVYLPSDKMLEQIQ